MPPQREGRALRQKAIIDILVDRKGVSSQEELVKLLRERGVTVTQSSISRDLQEIGVRRVKGRYQLQTWKAVGEGDFQQVVGFVQGINVAGSNLLVVHTSPSAANVVAWAIDTAGWPEVRGTVAGEDTIFIAVDGQEARDVLLRRLGHYLEG
ncbi:MAG TPA: arginine repressor [Thermoanaerobaculia bacterium]|nr:arginine repressor [Thermoanaerobaculia bacterium]